MKLTPSTALGNECKALAAELLKQPDLLAGVFLDSEQPLPESQQLVSAAKQYTGERSTVDDDRLLMVGALHLLGATDREIERTCGVTRRTIPVLLEALEKSGRVTPLKERLLKQVSVLAEKSGRTLGELLDEVQDGKRTLELAAMVKAVGQVHSFQIEKYQLLTGQATEIVETRVAAGREEFEKWWRESASPIDSESTGNHAVFSVSNTETPSVTSLSPPMTPAPAPPAAGTPLAGGGSDGVGAGDSSTV